MVNGLRRSSSRYPLNQRCYGKTWRERLLIKSIKQFVVRCTPLLPLVPIGVQPILAGLLLNAIQRERYLTRWMVNPLITFHYRHRVTATFSDSALFNMRIRNRAHIPRLLQALQIPVRWNCDTGVVEDREVGLLMWFYWASFPRQIYIMQNLFGREFSQISRILKAVWTYINTRWGDIPCYK